jgi:hypothetical protein
MLAWSAGSHRAANELAHVGRCRAARVLDAHRRGQFVTLTRARTGGPRHRFSTTELDDGDRRRPTTDEGRPPRLVRLAEAMPAWSAGSHRAANELAHVGRCRAAHVLDAHRRGQFVTLPRARTGGPRHRFSTTDLDGDRQPTADEGRPTKDERRASFVLLKPCPRGAPVRIAQRTNWHTWDDVARPASSTLTDEASSSR